MKPSMTNNGQLGGDAEDGRGRLTRIRCLSPGARYPCNATDQFISSVLQPQHCCFRECRSARRIDRGLSPCTVKPMLTGLWVSTWLTPHGCVCLICFQDDGTVVSNAGSGNLSSHLLWLCGQINEDTSYV